MPLEVIPGTALDCDEDDRAVGISVSGSSGGGYVGILIGTLKRSRWT